MKTIKALREVADAATPAAKRFKKKHVTVKHDDVAGNKDDIYQATNIKTAERTKERHGYEPGADEAVYENAQQQMAAWNDQKKQENVKKSIGYIEAKLKITKDASRRASYEKDLASFKSMVKEEMVDEDLLSKYLDEAASIDIHRAELKKVHGDIEQIVQSGGRVTLADPLTRKLKYHAAAIKRLKKLKEENLGESRIAGVLKAMASTQHSPEELKAGTTIRTRDQHRGIGLMGKVVKVEPHHVYGHAVFFKHADGRTLRTPISNVRMVKEEVVDEAVDKDMQRKLQQQRMRDLGYSHPTKSGKWARKGNPKVDVSKEKDGNLYDPALLLKKEETELTELSTDLLARYKKKAYLDHQQADKVGDIKRGNKRFSGVIKATKKQLANDVRKEEVLPSVKTLTPKQIADKHGTTVEAIEAQMKKGIAVEKEHTKDAATAREIALDHLKENPKYYDKLSKMEKSMKKEDVELTEAVLDPSTLKSLKKSGAKLKERSEELAAGSKKDHFDYHTVGDHLSKGHIDDAKKHIRKLDTAVRDEIFSHIHPDHFKHFNVDALNHKRSLHDYNTSMAAKPKKLKEETEMNEAKEACGWFARCKNPATGGTPHPILGMVPTCDRCHKFATGETRAASVDAKQQSDTMAARMRQKGKKAVKEGYYIPDVAKKLKDGISYREVQKLTREGKAKGKADAAKAKKAVKEEAEQLEEGRNPKETEYRKARSDVQWRLHEIEKALKDHQSKAEKGKVHFAHVGDVERVHSDLKQAHRNFVSGHEFIKRDHEMQSRLNAAMKEEVELTEAAKHFAHQEYLKAHKDVAQRLSAIRDEMGAHHETAKANGFTRGHTEHLHRLHSELKHIHHYLTNQGEYGHPEPVGRVVTYPSAVHEAVSAETAKTMPRKALDAYHRKIREQKLKVVE